MDEAEGGAGAGVRAMGVGVTVALAVVAARLPTPDGLTPDAHTVAVVGALMAVWWVTDLLPRAVTALVPLVAFPLLGVSPMSKVAPGYAHPLLFLMLGGFVLGHGMARVGLHERLTALLLRPDWVRAGPRRVAAALMAVTALLSGLVSNTATVLMMLPLAVALARVADGGPKVAPAFVLGLAYASSVGGMTTLVGTPPNAVLAGQAATLVGRDIGFATWMGVGVPAALLLLPAAWWCVTRVGYDLPATWAHPLPAPPMPAAHPSERRVVALVGLALVAWLTRDVKDLGPVVVPGWSSWVPGKGFELDAAVAVATAVLLFVVPGRDAEGRSVPLVGWRDTERAIPWSVLLLLGGGFALAGAIADSGLTAWLARGGSALAGLPVGVSTLLVCVAMTFVTELTSNTATAQIALPLLAEAAPAAGVDPLLWMVPATLSASCAFMMPVATAPNAIAAEAGAVSGRDMARAGLVLNAVGAVGLTLLCLVVVPWVFPAPG